MFCLCHNTHFFTLPEPGTVSAPAHLQFGTKTPAPTWLTSATSGVRKAGLHFQRCLRVLHRSRRASPLCAQTQSPPPCSVTPVQRFGRKENSVSPYLLAIFLRVQYSHQNDTALYMDEKAIVQKRSANRISVTTFMRDC